MFELAFSILLACVESSQDKHLIDLLENSLKECLTNALLFEIDENIRIICVRFLDNLLRLMQRLEMCCEWIIDFLFDILPLVDQTEHAEQLTDTIEDIELKLDESGRFIQYFDLLSQIVATNQFPRLLQIVDISRRIIKVFFFFLKKISSMFSITCILTPLFLN